jgi:signal transduction histidine kinase
MSERINELTTALLQARLRILHHAMKVRETIISAMFTERDTGRLHAVVAYLTTLAKADVGYFILFSGEEILSVDLYTEQDSVRFRLGDKPRGLGNCPVMPKLETEPHESLIGALRLAASLYLPILNGDLCIGFLEIGNFEQAMAPDRANLLLGVHRQLLQTYRLLHDYHCNLSANRSLRAQLEQTKKMYQTVMSSSHDMILSFDTACRITGINNFGRTLLGIAADTDPGMLDIASPDIGFIVNKLESGTALSDIEVALTAAGRTIFCLASFSAEWNVKNEIASINGVFKDITDRIIAQRELLQTNIELSDANQQLKVNQQQMIQQEKLASIGQLAAGVAHEINNPLGFIQSNHLTLKQYVERLLSYVAKLETLSNSGDSLRKEYKVAHLIEDLPQLLAESDEGYHRIIKIVQSLKNFSRIDAFGSLAVVDLNAAIDDTLTVARNNWKYVAEVETDYRLVKSVECFLDELNQVFLNIVVNAAQAIADHRPDGTGRIWVKTWEESGKACIQVDDNGPGIPESIRNRVFEPFFTTKSIGKGTGLGLSMAYDSVVKKHHGDIKILESEFGGACFRITLPLVQDHGSLDVVNAVE